MKRHCGLACNSYCTVALLVWYEANFVLLSLSTQPRKHSGRQNAFFSQLSCVRFGFGAWWSHRVMGDPTPTQKRLEKNTFSGRPCLRGWVERVNNLQVIGWIFLSNQEFVLRSSEFVPVWLSLSNNFWICSSVACSCKGISLFMIQVLIQIEKGVEEMCSQLRILL